MVKKNPKLKDMRLGIERRRFSYTAYIPERRSGKDRRHNPEYRSCNKCKEIYKKTKRGSKTSDRAPRECSAYRLVCEHFEETRNPPKAD